MGHRFGSRALMLKGNLYSIEMGKGKCYSLQRRMEASCRKWFENRLHLTNIIQNFRICFFLYLVQSPFCAV